MTKKSCVYCAKLGILSKYNDECRTSKSRHRLKYNCELPKGKGHPPRKHDTNAARKKAERERMMILRTKKKAKEFLADKHR